MRERGLPVFRGPQTGDGLQRTQLQRTRFAGRRHVRGQARRVLIPTDTGAEGPGEQAGGGRSETVVPESVTAPERGLQNRRRRFVTNGGDSFTPSGKIVIFYRSNMQTGYVRLYIYIYILG